MQFSTRKQAKLTNQLLLIVHQVTTKLALRRTKQNRDTWRLSYPHRVAEKMIWTWRHEQITDEF